MFGVDAIQRGIAPFTGGVMPPYSNYGAMPSIPSTDVSSAKIAASSKSSGLFPSILSGVGSLLAGGLNFLGSERTNRANRRLAEEQMAFQRESVQRQMDFQERMSSTAYQRAMADMRAAGLNPILAYSQGGASAPSGASSSGSLARMKDSIGAGVSSALSALALKAQIEQTKVATALLKADLPSKIAESRIWSSSYGTPLKVLEILSKPVSSAVSAVGKVIR